MKGRGKAFGAVSVVNAIAGGRGTTVGVELETEATVELESRPGDWTVRRNGKKAESKLVVETVASVLRIARESPGDYSGTILTSSNIPVGVGLKSSSSSSAAVALATSAALRENLGMRRIMLCSAESSLKVGVSLTGAFDDVAACVLGGLNLADNIRKRLLKSRPLQKSFKVLITLPHYPSRRSAVELRSIRKLAAVADAAFEMSLRGDIWRAMTINGLFYSSVFRYDPTPALTALRLGALGAGLSGTGPAVAAVFDGRRSDRVGELTDAWRGDGSKVIVTETNDKRGESRAVE